MRDKMVKLNKQFRRVINTYNISITFMSNTLHKVHLLTRYMMGKKNLHDYAWTNANIYQFNGKSNTSNC